MRLWLKIILIVLLAVRTNTSAGQSVVLQASHAAPASPAAKEKEIDRPQHPACLTEEQESVHSSPHLRWPLALPSFFSSKKTDKAALFAADNELPFTANTPLQAFYRSLLFPAHFFR